MGKLKATMPQLNEGSMVKQVKRWLYLDAADMREQDKVSLSEVLSQSKQMETVYAMRQELTGLWMRSSATKEQLLGQLQDWCHRAEASGIDSLQTFSRKLRCYA
jgi:stearoyl-CoA desaturase (delta-9 desaturase)